MQDKPIRLASNIEAATSVANTPETENSAAEAAVHSRDLAPSGAKPPQMINPGSTRHDGNDGFVCEDFLSAGFYVHWADWAATRKKLVDARSVRRLDNRQLLLAGTWFAIGCRGERLGKHGPFFEFAIEGRDHPISILIKDSPLPGLNANIWATLTGKYFLRTGDARHGYEKLRNIIGELGGRIERSELSRIDICLDLPGVSMQAFTDAYEADQYICRAQGTTYKSSHSDGSECNTLYFGGSGSRIRCCIYDKLCEARRKKTLEAMQDRRWGGAIPECATRVEFRIRRKALKKRGIDSIEDLFELEGDLLDYLTTSWLRFTDMPVDRKNRNQGRVGTLPLWSRIHEEFLAGVGGLSEKPWAPIRSAPVDVSHHGKTAVGLVVGAAKIEGRSLRETAEFNAYAQELMKPYAGARLPLVI